MSAPRGVCSGGGGVSAPGVSALGGVCSMGVPAPWGVPAPGGGVVSQHALRQTPPMDRQTGVKNTTFATSLRTVKTCTVLID